MHNFNPSTTTPQPTSARQPVAQPEPRSRRLSKPLPQLLLAALAALAIAAGALLAIALPESTPVEAQIPEPSTFAIHGVGASNATPITDTDANFSFTPGLCHDDVSSTPPTTNQDSPVVTQGVFASSTGNNFWISIGAVNFKMNTGCDYAAAMSVGTCDTISVALAKGGGAGDVLQYAANDPKTGDVKFSGQSIAFSLIYDDLSDLYFDTDSSDGDPDNGDFGMGLVEVKEFRYEIIVGGGCSSKPTLALHADSQGSNATSTTDPTPKFTVSNVANSASVTVTAEKASTPTVTKTASVGSGATSVDVEFTDRLSDGSWMVKATHTDGSKTAADSDVLTLTVDGDTVAPVVTVTVDPPSGTARSKSYSATDDDSGTTTWKYARSSAFGNMCPGMPTGATTDYTEGDSVVIDDMVYNNALFCFWSTDAADNTGVGQIRITGIGTPAPTDTTKPSVTVRLDKSSVAVGGTVTATFALSEAPKAETFTAADVTVAPAGRLTPGTLTAGSGNTYTMVLTAATEGSARVSLDANKFEDAAGNGNTASTAATSGSDTITVTAATTQPPTDTTKPTVTSITASPDSVQTNATSTVTFRVF